VFIEVVDRFLLWGGAKQDTFVNKHDSIIVRRKINRYCEAANRLTYNFSHKKRTVLMQEEVREKKVV